MCVRACVCVCVCVCVLLMQGEGVSGDWQPGGTGGHGLVSDTGCGGVCSTGTGSLLTAPHSG